MYKQFKITLSRMTTIKRLNRISIDLSIKRHNQK
jgi:hypothetical protein